MSPDTHGQWKSIGRWMRTVTEPLAQSSDVHRAVVQRTEYLDMEAAEKRLLEAVRERPEAGVRCWLDVALNGWGDA